MYFLHDCMVFSSHFPQIFNWKTLLKWKNVYICFLTWAILMFQLCFFLSYIQRNVHIFKMMNKSWKTSSAKIDTCIHSFLETTQVWEEGRWRPTQADYTAIDRDPEKQALTFLLIELNTFYGTNRWDRDDEGCAAGVGKEERGSLVLWYVEVQSVCTYSLSCRFTHMRAQMVLWADRWEVWCHVVIQTNQCF